MSNDLHQELEEVKQLLYSVPSDLGPPLRDLVESQLTLLAPHRCAWFVLAAAAYDTQEFGIRSKRISLAAALETLYLALNIHKHLLKEQSSADDSAPERSFIGSMILAGDFCFSRSAEFAANTNEPIVVSIFSDVLATISEGYLRQLHGKALSPYEAVPDLIMAGVNAAIELCPPPAPAKEAITQISQELIADVSPPLNTPDVPSSASQTSSRIHKSNLLRDQLALLPKPQQLRWQALASTVIAT